MKRAILFVVCLMATVQSWGQTQVVVSGVVSDALGPIVGAAVVQQGTTNGVVTGLDGEYSITVPAGSVVEYSCIGYVSVQYSANESGTHDVLLEEDTMMLEETVVIGYGVQKKSNVTGAISSVKSDDLQNKPITNAASALQGKVSGVQVVNSSGAPGASPAIRIRGYSSNGSSDPLYIVDGLKVEDISYLDPSSISSMEILKDAASAAIYGAEAGNGVILITTKSGKAGQTAINFDASVSLSSLARKVELLNAAQYAQFYAERDGSTFTNLYNQYNIEGVNTDWQDAMFGTGVMQNYNLGVLGGNEDGSFYAALGYNDNDGMVKLDKDYYKRITGQVNASYKIRKWLEVGSNNTISATDAASLVESQRLSGQTRSIMLMDPLTPVYYSDENMPAHLKAAAENGHNLLQASDGRYYGMSWVQNGINPLAGVEGRTTTNKAFTLNGSAYANITPVHNLVMTSRLGYTLGGNNAVDYQPRQLKKYLDTTSDELMNLESSTYNMRYYQWENFANYLLETDKAGSFTFMAGMSYSNNEVSFSKGKTNALSSEANNFVYLDYSTSGADDSVQGNTTYQRKIAYFGRLGWDYGNRYNVQVNFRADSYDAAYLDMGHNWGYFPSVSAGWIFSNEDFMRNVKGDLFSYGKVRLSYGINGSISNLGGYMYAATLGAGQRSAIGIVNTTYNLDGTLYTGIYPSSKLANPELRWERSKQFDAGLDLRFFKDRLSLTADYYYKVTDGLLVESNASWMTGASTVFQNLGIVTNRGLELELDWKDTIGDFRYGVNANFSTVKNLVKEYKGEGTRIEGSAIQGVSSPLTWFEEGYPVWYLRGYKFAGVDSATGAPVFEDLDGVDGITDNDKTYLGKGIPDYTYGITLTMGWRGLDVSVYGTGAQNYQLLYGLMGGDSGAHDNRLLLFYQDRWTAANPGGKYPSSLYQMTDNRLYQSDMLVFDASFFKIKQIQLGYSFPQSIMSRLPISSLRLYASMDNWFTFTKYPGSDPEVNALGFDSSALAIDYGGYPLAKSLSFGVNVSF